MSREAFDHEPVHDHNPHQREHVPVAEDLSHEDMLDSIAEPTIEETPKYAMVREKRTTELEDYIDCFRIEEITKDKEAAQQKLIKIALEEAALPPEEFAVRRENKRVADMLEDITTIFGNDPPWIPNARFIKASKFDDLFRGTDLILDIKQPKTGRPIIVAIDVTTGRNEVSGKLHSVISPGAMIFNRPSVKYHPGMKYMQEEREKGNEVKPVAIAKLVLGASPDIVKEASTLLHPAANAKDRLTAKNVNRLKYVLLEGGLVQARGLQKHALAIGQVQTANMYGHIADVFQKAVDLHNSIFGEFSQTFGDITDPVLDEIKTIESTRYRPTGNSQP